jgi:hypothetical protein
MIGKHTNGRQDRDGVALAGGIRPFSCRLHARFASQTGREVVSFFSYRHSVGPCPAETKSAGAAAWGVPKQEYQTFGLRDRENHPVASSHFLEGIFSWQQQ